VDSHAVRRSFDGLVTKFEVHGHLDAARKLRELVTTFLSYEVFHDHPQVRCLQDKIFNISVLRFTVEIHLLVLYFHFNF
jgi:hypothetical protein